MGDRVLKQFHRVFAALAAVGIIAAIVVAAIFLSNLAQKPVRDQRTVIYVKTYPPPVTHVVHKDR